MAAPAGRRRGIDHAVLPVRDLATAADTYGRLGFTLTPEARHPWGTANRLVQFDAAFLELLAVADPALIEAAAPGHFSFGAFNSDFLARGEGMSMLVLDSEDSDADIVDFAAHGLQTFERFDFERIARSPEGEARKVGFSLAFAASPALTNAGFFTCRQHYPENFWRSEYQRHANGARGIAGVTMVARDPADHHEFLSAFTGVRDFRMTGFGLEIDTARGAVEVLTPRAFHHRYGLEAPAIDGWTAVFAALRIAVDDVAAAEALVAAAGFGVTGHEGRAVVAAAEAHGVALAFEVA